MEQCVAQWREIEGLVHLYTYGNRLLCKGILPRILQAVIMTLCCFENTLLVSLCVCLSTQPLHHPVSPPAVESSLL